MIQAVIFDMYETLVTQFSSPLYYGTQIAGDLGLTPEEFLPGWRATEEARATGKMTFEEAIELQLRSHGIFSGELFQQVVQKRLSIQSDCFSRLHPEILPMLSALKDRDLKIGLISNCFSEEAVLIRESPLFPYFDAPCLSYEVGIRKPDPAIFQYCLEQLRIPAENCLYVGDGERQELEAARAAGMRPIQAVWYRREEFGSHMAAIRPEISQADHPMQLLELLGR
ncbi:MAG: HAD family hydrolase [Oscillospiraceae bacterium]|nr:HAD family hydrolase [Oscillospiraceae bacterium]